MKNVLIIHHFGGLGGAGKSLINNVRLLSGKCNLTIITPNHPSDILLLLSEFDDIRLLTTPFIPSIPIYNGGYNLLSPGLYFHLLKSICYLKSFLNLVKEQKSDVIVVNSIIMAWVAFFFFHEEKKVCFVRETKSESIFNSIIRKLLNKFNLVCFISQFDSASWSLQTDSIVNENSVDADLVKEDAVAAPQEDEKKLNLIYLGGTSYIKGFYHLCLSLLMMKDRSKINIYVLGECRPIIKWITRLIFGKSKPLTFVGSVQNVNDYYAKSAAVIFPVIKAHQGRPIFEAGQHRKGAIIPDFENFSEFVANNENGIIYKRRSSSSLANILTKAANGEYDFFDLGESNFARFNEKHSIKSAQLRSQDLISKILNI